MNPPGGDAVSGREVWSAAQVADHLGYTGSHRRRCSVARMWLHRRGLRPVAHVQVDGGRVEGRWDAQAVRAAAANRVSGTRQ